MTTKTICDVCGGEIAEKDGRFLLNWERRDWSDPLSRSWHYCSAGCLHRGASGMGGMPSGILPDESPSTPVAPRIADDRRRGEK